MRHFIIVFFSFILFSSSVFALTCKNDYGGSASCASNANAVGDCQTLGFSKADVTGCESYIYCPFDTTYKRCVSAPVASECPAGYSTSITSQADCDSPSACSIAVISESNNKCGKCITAACGSDSYCSKAACEAKNVRGCKSSLFVSIAAPADDPYYPASGTTFIQCWNPSSMVVGNPCCDQLGLTTGTVYDCVSQKPDSNGLYLYACRTSPLAGYNCTKGTCGQTTACTSGYARSAANCGVQGTAGWSLGTETDSSGCSKCLANTCAAGSGKVYTDCHKQFGTTYGISQKTTGYSGDTACKQCLPANCKVYGDDLYTYAQITEVIRTIFGERYINNLSNSNKETANLGLCYWGVSSCGAAHSFVIQDCVYNDTACVDTAQKNWDRCIEEVKAL